jgi:hypothetical protein
LIAHDGRVLLSEWIESRVHHDLRTAGVLGWAWATVDLERALADAGESGADEWSPVEDELLGARGRRLAGVEPAVILLEPSTEGRLAGWLAHNGEGEAAIYRTANGLATQRPRMTALGRPGSIQGADPRTSNGAPLEVLVAPASER